MKLNIKRLNLDATLPTYATSGSKGLDLYASAVVFKDKYIEVRTGIALEIPEGWVGLIFPRSSVTEKNIVLGNSVGVIDSDYRGEIIFRFKVLDSNDSYLKFHQSYKEGDRVGQLLLVEVPRLEVIEVKELSETIRDTGGYGSSGT